MSTLTIGTFVADSKTTALSEKRTMIVDPENSFYDVDGGYHQNVIGRKIVLEFVADFLTDAEANSLKSQLALEEVGVNYSTPEAVCGTFKTISVTTEFSSKEGNVNRWRVRASLEMTSDDDDSG